MKYSPKQKEPPCLSEYRNDSPKATWNQFASTKCYKTVRESAAEDQHGLCAYCEMLLGPENRQIAHFHPKSDCDGSTNWAILWSNLWLACRGGNQSKLTSREEFLKPVPENRSCDVNKENQIVDGQVLAPNEVPLYPRIFRFQQHRDLLNIVPDELGCKETGIPIEKVEKTIAVFNLNCVRLSSARMRVYRSIDAQIGRIRRKHPEGGDRLKQYARENLAYETRGSWKSYFTMRRWRFGNNAEMVLKEIEYLG